MVARVSPAGDTARIVGRTLHNTYGAGRTARFLLSSLDYDTDADRPVWEHVGVLRSLLGQAIGALEAADARLDVEIEAHRNTAATIVEAALVGDRIRYTQHPTDRRPGDRSSFADGPLAAGPVLVDRRVSNAGRDGHDRRDSTGLIAWSPIRRRWEHWAGARCIDVDSNVEALSRRHPRADVHAPAEVDS